VFFRALAACIVFLQVSNAYSYEGSLEADVDARTEYNTNIFLTKSAA